MPILELKPTRIGSLETSGSSMMSESLSAQANDPAMSVDRLKLANNRHVASRSPCLRSAESVVQTLCESHSAPADPSSPGLPRVRGNSSLPILLMRPTFLIVVDVTRTTPDRHPRQEPSAVVPLAEICTGPGNRRP